MDRRLPPLLPLPLALLLAAAPPAPAARRGAEPADPDAVAAARARGLLEAGEGGGLVVAGALVVEAIDGRTIRGALEAAVELDPLPGEVPSFLLSLVLDRGDGPPEIRHRRVEPGDLGRAAAWFYQSRIELADETREAVLVVEEPASGLWGGALLDLVEEPLPSPAAAVISLAAEPWRAAVPAAAASAAPAATGRTAIRLLPPRGNLEGSVRFEALVADVGVDRVAFLLDGEAVAESGRPPFAAKVELAGAGRPQTVRAVAYAADGRELGADELTVHADERRFAVRIARLTGEPGGAGVEVEAEVTLPARARLDRVELYWNEELAARLSSPPFRARLEPGVDREPGYVRAVAYLADGTWAEGVALLDGGALGEEVDVTLVELFVVVTGREGGPVRGLTKDDFVVRQGRQQRRIERFSYAEDVPLQLGLVVDTSESMGPIMDEAKRAAAQFLGQTISPIDRAFLVDFDTLPRLQHAATGDVMALVARFAALKADGYTALFDSIIFSLFSFDSGRGRRALVVVTDGDDYKSRFGANRSIRYARKMGVPVYLIGLVDPGRLRGYTRLELEAVTAKAGGRLYFVDGADRLRQAYAEINAELRSQYLLTYYADGPLSAEERAAIEVEVEGKGLSARTVVGAE